MLSRQVDSKILSCYYKTYHKIYLLLFKRKLNAEMKFVNINDEKLF